MTLEVTEHAEGLRPLYTEYNIGNYTRSFRLSSEIEQDSIKADLKDGVVTLMLPKAAKAKPRKRWADVIRWTAAVGCLAIITYARRSLRPRCFNLQTSTSKRS